MSKLKELVAKFNKDHKYEVVKVGITRDDPPRIPTGVFQFDLATGGGIPAGRVTVLYGAESSMKTTMACKVIASAQRMWPERRAVFVDLEGTFSRGWARRMGVDTDAMVYAKPSSAEQAVDLIEGLIYAEDVSVVVLDSVAALVTQHELDSPAEKAMVGTQGILINKLYRKTARALSIAEEEGRQPTLVMINQIRFKVGVTRGDPETMPGGPSFKYAASLVVRLYGKDEYLKDLSTTLPAYKKISAIVKKWKVPITARAFEYALALLPNPKLGLAVGESYDVATIMHYLKSYELLVKAAKSGWVVRDEHGEILIEAKTQDAIETKIRTEPEFNTAIRALILRIVLEQGEHLDPN